MKEGRTYRAFTNIPGSHSVSNKLSKQSLCASQTALGLHSLGLRPAKTEQKHTMLASPRFSTHTKNKHRSEQAQTLALF